MTSELSLSAFSYSGCIRESNLNRRQRREQRLYFAETRPASISFVSFCKEFRKGNEVSIWPAPSLPSFSSVKSYRFTGVPVSFVTFCKEGQMGFGKDLGSLRYLL